MLTKGKKFIVFHIRKKEKHSPSFFELARKHIVRSKDPRNRTLSQDIDKILYGAN